jgi:hypothetical protein
MFNLALSCVISNKPLKLSELLIYKIALVIAPAQFCYKNDSWDQKGKWGRNLEERERVHESGSPKKTLMELEA